MTKIRGIMPAIVTPLDANGDFNVPVMRDLVEYLLATGISGLYTTGSTGESLLLDLDERKHILEVVLETVDGRVPVIAHVGATATHTAVKLAKHAATVGATAVAAMPSTQGGMDRQGIKSYYTKIAQAAGSTPTWMYYLPQATGVSLTIDGFAELVATAGISGVKYTSHNLFEMQNLIARVGTEDFTVISGPDEMCLPALTMGARGAIGTTYNIMSTHYIRLFSAHQNGDLATAQTLQYEANRVIQGTGICANYRSS